MNGDGPIKTNSTGNVKGYGKVWYHPDSLANVMSFANVCKKFKVKVSMGPSDLSPSIVVTATNDKIMRFNKVENGLYVYVASNDICKNDKSTLNKSSYNYLLVSTIKQNENKFTTREIVNVKKALDLYKKTGRPSYETYFHILENNLIRDCLVTTADAKQALKIYRKDAATIKGKTKCKNPEHIKTQV